jgi:NADPH2:quinone reductase
LAAGGEPGRGADAELIAVPVARLRRKPNTLSSDEAVSVGVNDIAAWCGIEAALGKGS